MCVRVCVCWLLVWACPSTHTCVLALSRDCGPRRPAVPSTRMFGQCDGSFSCLAAEPNARLSTQRWTRHLGQKFESLWHASSFSLESIPKQGNFHKLNKKLLFKQLAFKSNNSKNAFQTAVCPSLYGCCLNDFSCLLVYHVGNGLLAI